MNKIDIKKILHEISENEHEKYRAFKERLEEYCTNKKNTVIGLFRVLRRIEIDLHDSLCGKIHINVNRSIIIKVLKTIRIEIEIIRHKMKHPHLFIKEYVKPLPPAGKWTSDKIDLVEIIYAIKQYINHGDVSIKTIQEGCEYFFQVELGDIETRIKEIDERQGNKLQFLESLIHNLNHFHDELKDTKNNKKIKWTGSVVDWVELVYALHAAGYANGGQTTLKELFKEMGDFFDFEVKEFSRTFKDIKNRVKGDRTRFLDELKRVLQRKIEESDERPSKK